MRASPLFSRFSKSLRRRTPLVDGSVGAALLALSVLTTLSPSSLADSRRMAVAQGPDLSLRVRLDPTLAPDVQVLRYPTRMVIVLPDSAFPKGFAPGSLRVDAPSRARVSVSRHQNATAVTIRGERVSLALQDLSGLASAGAPNAAPVTPATATPAAEVASPVIAPLALLAQSVLTREPMPRAQAGSLKTPPPRASVVSSRRTPRSETPARLLAQATPDAAPAQNAPTAQPAVTTTEPAFSAAPMAPPDASQTPTTTSPESDASSSGDPSDNIPLSTLMGAREPIITDAALVRLLVGLVIALVLVVGALRFLLPRLLRRRLGQAHARSGRPQPPMRPGRGLPSPTSAQTTVARQGRPRSQAYPSDWGAAAHGRSPSSASQARLGGGLLGMAASWLQARREREIQRQQEAVRQMNPAFRILETRELGRGKTLHRVDLWGRQLIIATSPKSISLLAVLDDEGQDLYFNDAEAENGRLLAQLVGDREALRDVFRQAERHWTPVSDLPEFERSQPTERVNRAVRLESTFDDLYRKYLDEPVGAESPDSLLEGLQEDLALEEDEPLDGDAWRSDPPPVPRSAVPSRAAAPRPHAPAQPQTPSPAPATENVSQTRIRRVAPTRPPVNPPQRPPSAKASAGPTPRRDRPSATAAPQTFAPQPEDWVVLSDYEDEFEP